MAATVLGIDIGGTKLAAGVVDAAGGILARGEIPTVTSEGPDRVLERVVGLAKDVLVMAGESGKGIARIGIACSGPLDREAGLVFRAPNLPGWVRVPVVEYIQNALAVPAVLENDANAAALGEFRYGVGKGADSLVYLTVSTGIGGGIILGGKIWHGVNCGAGEVGHITLVPDGPPCGCGSRGCLEALSSGTAIARRARELLKRGGTSRLRDIPNFDASDVARLAQEGDELAGEVWQAAVKHLALGIVAIITILGPELIIIGGGVSKAGDFLFQPLRQEVRRHIKVVPVESLRILPAALARNVGILGAAAVAFGS
jgi:glucokinase